MFLSVRGFVSLLKLYDSFETESPTEEHLYRLHVERGAAEPVEISFKVTGRSSWGGDHGHGFRSKEITMLMLALTL